MSDRDDYFLKLCHHPSGKKRVEVLTGQDLTDYRRRIGDPPKNLGIPEKFAERIFHAEEGGFTCYTDDGGQTIYKNLACNEEIPRERDIS